MSALGFLWNILNIIASLTIASVAAGYLLGYLDVQVVKRWRPSMGDTRCQECHHPYEPWSTNHRLWNRVMGSDGGILCPRCFAIRATKARPQTVWSLEDSPSRTETELRRALFHERENFQRAADMELRALKAEAELEAMRKGAAS